jgi:hypothetical protein
MNLTQYVDKIRLLSEDLMIVSNWGFDAFGDFLRGFIKLYTTNLRKLESGCNMEWS